MTAHAHQRGNEIISSGKVWTYKDRTPISEERPCVRCGRMPTPEGHDACLGNIPGVESACCGHGVEEPEVRLCDESMRSFLSEYIKRKVDLTENHQQEEMKR